MKLTFVTTNDGKFREFSASLQDSGVELVRRSQEYPEIQTDTLEKVVRFGLDWLREKVPGNYVIDDSGLFIDRLRGFPGVYSAYVLKTIGLDGVLGLMKGQEDRAAEFATTIGLFNDGDVHIFTGRCRGKIITSPEGTGGFGYDPIFVPDGDLRTFAGMTVVEKNSVSHRGKALKMLNDYIKRNAVS